MKNCSNGEDQTIDTRGGPDCMTANAGKCGEGRRQVGTGSRNELQAAELRLIVTSLKAEWLHGSNIS